MLNKKMASNKPCLPAGRGFTLIEILVVMGLIAILAAIVLIAINPGRQFRQARDSQRTSNVSAILSAIGQYTADNKGAVPAGIPSGASSAVEKNIKTGGADLCALLVPKYISALPVDPSVSTGSVTDCAAAYDSKYKVWQDSASGRITVSADGEEPAGTDNVTITR